MTSGWTTTPCCCAAVGSFTCQATRPAAVTSLAQAPRVGHPPEAAGPRAAAGDVAAGPAALVAPQATAESRTVAAAQPTAKAGLLMSVGRDDPAIGCSVDWCTAADCRRRPVGLPRVLPLCPERRQRPNRHRRLRPCV